jgi:hypothetical protein
MDSRFGVLLDGSGFYSEMIEGRGRGAIITLGFECFQMTVGTQLHTVGMKRGDDHDRLRSVWWL